MGSTIDGGFWKTSTKKESTIDKAITPSFAVVGGLEDSVRVEGVYFIKSGEGRI